MRAPPVDEMARLIGDPSRAAMLDALMDGRAWTGRELARAAHVTPSTASEHLQRLVSGHLISVTAQGRHRYYALASPEIAQALEALTYLAARRSNGRAKAVTIDLDLRRARTCYDHLAGQLGVALADALIARDAIAFGPTGGTLTPSGAVFFRSLGIAIDEAGRRVLCRPCLDWSERRYHLAGSAGAALARHALEGAWLYRKVGTRAVGVTSAGVAALRDAFGVEWQLLDQP